MYHEIEELWKNRGETHTFWYIAMIVLDYNGYDENAVSDTIFKLLLIKVHSQTRRIEWQQFKQFEPEQQDFLK